MTHAFSSLDELGDGPGFRKVRGTMGITAFGVNGVVYPPGHPGIHHYHDTQDELYFVHSGTARVEVAGEERILGPGGLFHVESTTPRRIANVGDEDLVMLVIGGKDGYVERDGHVMSDEDLKLRQSFGTGVGSTEPAKSGDAGSAGIGAAGVGSTEPAKSGDAGSAGIGAGRKETS